MYTKRIPAGDRQKGFTAIELLAVMMVFSWSAITISAFVDVEEAHEYLRQQSEHVELVQVAEAADEEGDAAGRMLQALREELSEARLNDRAPPVDSLIGYRVALRDHRAVIEGHLATLEDLYPGLDRDEKRLARELRQPLKTIHRELERTALALQLLVLGYDERDCRVHADCTR